MKTPNFTLNYPGGELTLHRTRIMGILNLTPDSFSDGGQYEDVQSAIDRAWQMVDEGADVLDVGAQTSKPGAAEIGIEEEIKRLEPVLKVLQKEKYPLPISLDTYHPEVLQFALDQKWISILNDITGLRSPKMLEVVQKYQIPAIAMHMIGMPDSMQSVFSYEDVVEDIGQYFEDVLEKCSQNIVIDPGIGFGKSVSHNLDLIANLDQFLVLGVPVMLGASRKSFMGKTLDLEVKDRLEPSLAVAAYGVSKGVHILRVHDVWQTKRVVQMIEAIKPYEKTHQVTKKT